MVDYTLIVRESTKEIVAIADDAELMETMCEDLINGDVELPGFEGAEDFITVDIEVNENMLDSKDIDASVETEAGTFSYSAISKALKECEDSELEETEEELEDSIGEEVDSNPENWA